MKKVSLITSVVLAAIVCFACKSSSGPEAVVEKYFTHLGQGEFKEVKEYVLAEHHAYYDLLAQLMSAQESTEEMPKVKVTDIKCEITDDVAVCSCMVQAGEENPAEQTLQLKKVDKKWLVNQGKEGGMPTSDDVEEVEDDSTEDQVAEVEEAEEE